MVMQIEKRTDVASPARLVSAAASAAEEVLNQIQSTHDPAALVRAMAPHDLLVAWNIADDEQRADLLKLADKGQVDLLVDLRCWVSDTPDMDRLEELVGPLAMSDIGGATRVVDTLDQELLTLLLKRNARIHLVEDRNEDLLVPEESELIACPDGYYFIELPDPDQVTDVERALLQALLMKPFEVYQKELECVRHDLPSELTELAYKWRAGRLADQGFQTREEALEVVVPMTVEEARALADDAAEPPDETPGDVSLPVLYRGSFEGHPFLDQVMEILHASDDPDVQARVAFLWGELGAMTNLYFSAIGVEIGNVEEVARNVTWARDLLALGLSEVADGDEDEGARLLALLSPGVFLKVALGILYPLRKRARLLLQDRRLIPMGRKGTIFDPPYAVGLACLNRDIPAFWPSLNREEMSLHSIFEPRAADLVAFSSRTDVQQAVRLLEEAEQLPALLFDGLNCERPPVRATPASILLMNALANAAADRAPEPKPVLREEANVFHGQVLQTSEDQLISDALSVLASVVDVEPDFPRDPLRDPDPMRRLIVRLIRIGRSRLASDAPERTLLIENF